MPTENRSSNTEMVSDLLTCPFCGEKPEITKHHREDIYGFMHRCQVLGTISWGFREDQDGHIEKWNARAEPAEPHQAEPVLWRYRKTPARSWFYTAHKRSAEIALRDGYIVEEFYTHADPGEIERLRDELEIVKNNDIKWQGLREQEAEIKTLRAQLAELDALLADIERRHWSGVDFDLPADLVARIKDLSTNAKPSAPAATPDKCLDGGDCAIGGTCKWCPHTSASPAQQPS